MREKYNNILKAQLKRCEMIIRVQNRLSPLVKIDIVCWLHAEHTKKNPQAKTHCVHYKTYAISIGIDISLSIDHGHGILK